MKSNHFIMLMTHVGEVVVLPHTLTHCQTTVKGAWSHQMQMYKTRLVVVVINLYHLVKNQPRESALHNPSMYIRSMERSNIKYLRV